MLKHRRAGSNLFVTESFNVLLKQGVWAGVCFWPCMVTSHNLYYVSEWNEGAVSSHTSTSDCFASALFCFTVKSAGDWRLTFLYLKMDRSLSSPLSLRYGHWQDKDRNDLVREDALIWSLWRMLWGYVWKTSVACLANYLLLWPLGAVWCNTESLVVYTEFIQE